MSDPLEVRPNLLGGQRPQFLRELLAAQGNVHLAETLRGHLHPVDRQRIQELVGEDAAIDGRGRDAVQILHPADVGGLGGESALLLGAQGRTGLHQTAAQSAPELGVARAGVPEDLRRQRAGAGAGLHDVEVARAAHGLPHAEEPAAYQGTEGRMCLRPGEEVPRRSELGVR